MTGSESAGSEGSAPEDARPRRGRLVDRGAIFAGWVGLGMALVIVIALELIIAVQTLVFLAAPLGGALIGVYANVRSERWRPRWRVLTNAAYAGLVTGVFLAVLYVVLRLVFVYGDSGTRPDGTRIDCAPGPACTYARYLEEGRGDELTALGITDARSFEAAVWREQISAGGLLVFVTLAGAIVGGGLRNLRTPPTATREPAPA